MTSLQKCEDAQNVYTCRSENINFSLQIQWLSAYARGHVWVYFQTEQPYQVASATKARYILYVNQAAVCSEICAQRKCSCSIWTR
jgi:hypothetical protein